MASEQKEDVEKIFEGWKSIGNLDYVSCWYKKAADYMGNYNIRAALVSTNSITQGESVSILWKPLFESGVHIDFAYRTFIWDSEASIKAHVHCVIVGFSRAVNNKQKIIYSGENAIPANNINGYLLDAENIFIEKRMKPLCNVPEIALGGQAIDGGSCLIRIKPMIEEQREMSERCVRGLGYQGNNLLCSNWNTENMSELDYNGMFEYLYGMKYGEKFNSEDYPNGIPKEEFESLIMEYLPITAEQIRDYAVFDEENQTYYWVRLGCFNYAPTFFGTSLPEVVDIKENEDGMVTLTVEAVCDMVICDDAVITHELTVRFAEDGSFQYLGNEILNDGIMQIPDYQYRIKE